MTSNFKLYIVHNKYTKLITSYSSAEDELCYNLFSTFEEQFNHEENNQIKFTFQIAKYIDGNFAHKEDGGVMRVRNELLTLLPIGGKLRLVEDDNTIYDLIVTSIAPTLSNGNVIYTYTCQDEISYKWSKTRVGYSYSTTERGRVKNIYEIARDVIQDCGFKGWDAVESVFDGIQTGSPLSTQYISLEVEDSNPYNVIIEACNVLCANMVVDYKNKLLSFFQKNRRPFSGYRYRPERNMKNLTVTYDGAELGSILHVRGGTDEYEQYVTIVPAIPLGIQSDFLSGNGWQTQPTFNIIAETDVVTKDGDIITKTGDVITAGWSMLEYAAENYPYTTTTPALQLEEYAEYQNFVRALQAVPHLNQFLYDFDFFLQSGLMSQEVYSNLKELFDKNMRNNNVYLKIYTQQYYRDSWNFQNYLVDLETNFEELYALYSDISSTAIFVDAKNKCETHKQAISETQKKIKTLLDRQDVLNWMGCLYGNMEYKNIPEYQDLLQTIKSYEKRRDLYAEKVEMLERKKKTFEQDKKYDNNPDYINVIGELEYYASSWHTLITLVGQNTSDNESLEKGYFTLYEGTNIRSLYYEMLAQLWTDKTSLWNNRLITSESYDNKGSYGQIQKYEQANQLLWQTIYSEYGDFIYEQVYENADELRQQSLLDQALIYFEDVKMPKANYSVDTLHLGELEPYNLPMPQPGYRIKVYNELLNLNDNAINDIQYKEDGNDLVITSISYSLRKKSEASITVEQVTQYEAILQKLIKMV